MAAAVELQRHSCFALIRLQALDQLSQLSRRDAQPAAVDAAHALRALIRMRQQSQVAAHCRISECHLHCFAAAQVQVA